MAATTAACIIDLALALFATKAITIRRQYYITTTGMLQFHQYAKSAHWLHPTFVQYTKAAYFPHVPYDAQKGRVGSRGAPAPLSNFQGHSGKLSKLSFPVARVPLTCNHTAVPDARVPSISDRGSSCHFAQRRTWITGPGHTSLDDRVRSRGALVR